MRFKGTLILAALFAAIGAYVYFYEVRGKETREKAEEEEKKVFSFTADEVKGFYLRNYDDTFQLERGPTGWEIVRPLETRGDDSQIALILTSLENARIERVVADTAADLAAFGLDDPQVAIRIETDKAGFDTLFIGDHNPTQSFVYARLSGQNRVFLLPATVYNNANKKLHALRDKSVLSFEADDVRRLALVREDDTLLFEKEKDGKWWIEEPIRARGDRGKIERVLNNLRSLKAKDFASEGDKDLAEFDLDHPWGRVDLYLGGNLEMKTLLFGKAKGNADLFAKDASRQPVFVIPATIATQIKEDFQGFRDRKVIDFDREDVQEIRIVTPEKRITCRKGPEDEWSYYLGEDPVRHPAQGERISRFLSDLYNLRIEDFVGERGASLEPYGLDRPQVKVELSGKSGPMGDVSIGKGGTEKGEEGEKTYLYAVSGGDDWICTLPGNALDKLRPDETELEEKEEGHGDDIDAE